jgi:hypothetical protein
VPMLSFGEDQVQPWPFSAALESPLTHQHQSKPLPALALDHLDQNTTLPATMSLTILNSSPLPSRSPQHVLELALTSLTTTMHAIDRDNTCTAQSTRAQTRPGNAHARQDAPDDVSGRARASPCPVSSRLPSLSPCARRLTTVPSTSRTSPIGLGLAVDDALVKDLPPPYCHAAKKRTTRPFLPLPRHHSRQPRLDVANTPRPFLALSSPWNDDLAVDLPRAPRPPP